MRTRWARRLVFATLCGACGGGTDPTPPPPPPPPAPVSLTAVTPQSQSAQVGQALTVTMKVTTTSGTSVAGRSVVFDSTGGGSVSPASVVSDGSGQATTTWTIGTLAGTNTLSTAAAGATPLQFTAVGTPAPATGVLPVAGIGQTATVATAVGYSRRSRSGICGFYRAGPTSR